MTEAEFDLAWRESVAAALRMALAETGMSRRALARASGESERNLARYFDDTATDFREIPLLKLFGLAPFLDTTPDQVIGMARAVFEKRSGMSWGEHALAAKKGVPEPPESDSK